MSESDNTDRDVLTARALDRMANRQTALERHVAALTGALKAAVGPGGLANDRDEVAGPISWLLLEDADRGLTLMTDLCDWLERIYLRFTGATLPSCWLWHPDVVEELLWLRHAHADVYSSKGSWQRAGDWHDRYRPRVVERVKRYAGHCELSEHRAGAPQARPPQEVPLVGAAHKLTEFWTRADSATASRPEPTCDELRDSDAQARNYQTA